MSRKKITHSINQLLLNNRLLLLLAILLFLLMIFPFVHELYAGYIFVLEWSVSFLLIAGIYVVSAEKRTLIVAILIATLVLTIMWFNHFLQNSELQLSGLILEIVFFIVTTLTIISHVLEYKKVTADKIYGAICGYLLIGITWALIYSAIETARPGSFIFNNGIDVINHELFSYRFHFSYFMYYSFVTLSTLGYGDIAPLNTPARVFSSLEAIMGQLYVAVLIARLVGLHISHTYLGDKKS